MKCCKMHRKLISSFFLVDGKTTLRPHTKKRPLPIITYFEYLFFSWLKPNLTDLYEIWYIFFNSACFYTTSL